MKKLLKALNNTKIQLAVIFIIAVVIRFLYFPDNIYFGFDQARDAFESQDIYQNFNIKIVGPPTAIPNLFHGPLYWYVVGPIYLLGGGNPEFPAAFMRIYNAFGVFLIFWIGKVLFNKKVGVVASLLFAFSFEQTQYAIYFHHPPLAVLTVMLFYGGLALSIFKNRWYGIPLSLLGYGLSVQSEFQLPYLGIIFVVLFAIFRKKLLPHLKRRTVFASTIVFLTAISSYVVAEFVFGFRTTRTLLETITQSGGAKNFGYAFATYLNRLVLQIHDNIFKVEVMAPFILFTFISIAIFYVLRKKEDSNKVVFLTVWFLSTSVLTYFGPIGIYYTNVGISPALLLLTAFFTSKFSNKFAWVAPVVLIAIIASNISLISEQNQKGVIGDIQVQTGMLLGNEKKAIDYIYKEAEGKPIVVSASTMPLRVNTTWAYLFNWYGQSKYGRLPYWAGEVAQGYPGELPRWTSQEKEYVAFGIIEPIRGVRGAFIDQFKEEQKQYGKYAGELKLGDEVSQSQIVVLKSVHK